MDIFAPCALGGILTAETVARLTAKVVCGAANNQLATPDIAGHLRARGISYLPTTSSTAAASSASRARYTAAAKTIAANGLQASPSVSAASWR